MSDKKKKSEKKQKDVTDVTDVTDVKKFSDTIPKIAVRDEKTLLQHLIACPNCGKYHFRHLGFLEVGMHYTDIDKGVDSVAHSLAVKLCINSECYTAIVISQGVVFDVTKLIDRKAFEELDKKVNVVYSPSGNCEI